METVGSLNRIVESSQTDSLLRLGRFFTIRIEAVDRIL